MRQGPYVAGLNKTNTVSRWALSFSCHLVSRRRSVLLVNAGQTFAVSGQCDLTDGTYPYASHIGLTTCATCRWSSASGDHRWGTS